MRLFDSVAAATLILGLAGGARAATIGFGALPGNDGDPVSSYTESGFTVTAGTANIATGKFYGNPVPNLVFDFGYDPTTSGTVIVTSAGGSFTFASVDLSSGATVADTYDDYTITGFAGGTQAFTQTGRLFGSPTNAFVTVGSASGTSIDRLLITANGGNGSFSANLDNLVVQAAAVPEPASAALLGAGLGLLGWARGRRRSS